MCLRYIHSFKPITFQELRWFLTPNPYIPFRYHFIYTPQHPTASVVPFLSFRKLHSYSQSLPKPFSNAFPAVYISFCDEFTPKTNILNLPHRPVLLQSFQAIVFYNMRLRSVHSFRLHCAPGTTFVPHFEPLRSIMPAFVHPPQHRTA